MVMEHAGKINVFKKKNKKKNSLVLLRMGKINAQNMLG